jgi:SAM-dependent methyltransferase
MPEQRHDPHAAAKHRHDRAFDSERVIALLEIEGELARGLTEEAIAACAGLFADAGHEVRHIVDLGCGPGVGTSLLAAAFPAATVLAADSSSAMLDRVARRAERLGHGDRIATLQLDLNGDLQDLGRCDLLWAGMAIHHADDEIATLTSIRSLLAPGGLACLLERADPLSVRLADDIGRPGIWDRLDAARAAWYESVRDSLPGAMNADSYPSMLAAAGLEVVIERRLVDTVSPNGNIAAQEFVAERLGRSVRDLATAEPEDLEALSTFAAATPPAPGGAWDGAMVTSSRRLLVATAARA